ncbi:unnamed protein product [Clonostachys rosea f. rosea IK726]|uniref:Calcineurin-like phosphoesterase domain-containing protein n=2 Tax=Bionectria ochroleuca TaxID=29856 RepID=A0A0B7KQG8_BIOOC|nr:unnamed protein product [Clonostachys rosea f. rosea IK726]
MFGQRSSGLDQLIRRTKRNPWQESREWPCVFLAKQVYASRSLIPAQPVSNAVSVVCISDTHNYQPELPDGDILIHAGDLSQSGTFEEVQKTILWIRQQPFEYKVVIAGNHDLILDPSRDQDKIAEIGSQLEWGDIIYLENSSATLTCSNGRRLTVYGSPCSPQHGNWAFQYPRHNDVWSGTSFGDIDILVTHAPPRGHLDIMFLGCTYLLSKLWQTQLLLHVFGHVHEGYGQEWLQFDAVQEAYEQTIVAGGGIFNLVYLLYRRSLAWFEAPLESRCLLVNAAIVGGIYDEKKRKPIRVII